MIHKSFQMGVETQSIFSKILCIFFIIYIFQRLNFVLQNIDIKYIFTPLIHSGKED